jgi:hypothetical protein
LRSGWVSGANAGRVLPRKDTTVITVRGYGVRLVTRYFPSRHPRDRGISGATPGDTQADLRMWVVKNDRAQVITGRDEHRGDIYNCFHVSKRHGKWRIEESRFEDERATDDRAELLRRG